MKYTKLVQVTVGLLFTILTIANALAAPGDILKTRFYELQGEAETIAEQTAWARDQLGERIAAHAPRSSITPLYNQLVQAQLQLRDLMIEIENLRMDTKIQDVIDIENRVVFELTPFVNELVESVNAGAGEAAYYLHVLQLEENDRQQEENNRRTEQDIAALQSRLDVLENKYEDLKDNLKDALKDDDSDDVNRYKRQLRELEDEIDVLLHDIQVLFINMVQRHTTSYNSDLAVVRAGAHDLLDNIEETLKLKKVDRKRGHEEGIVSTPDITSSEPSVVVQQVDFLPTMESTETIQQPVNTLEDFRTTLWLIAGNIILFAIIIFFILLMV